MLFTKLIQSLRCRPARCHQSKVEPCSGAAASRTRSSSSGLRVESLETRSLLTTLAVDISDASCGNAGDNLYCQIQEAIDVAEAGDDILVQNGTYGAISIDVDDLSIQAVGGGEVIIDATGAESGVLLSADGVAIRGLTVENAVEDGFAIRGDSNRLQGNTSRDNGEEGFDIRGENLTICRATRHSRTERVSPLLAGVLTRSLATRPMETASTASSSPSATSTR